MISIQLEISDKAWKKLQSYHTLKRLLGDEHQTLSDLLLKKILQGVEGEETVVTIKAKED